MMKWLRPFFCRHDWQCEGDVMSSWYSPTFKCTKCGKVEGL